MLSHHISPFLFMHKKSLPLPLPLPLLITILLLACFPKGSLTSSSSCHPYTCNGMNIRTPFWIPGLQESHCGRPGFNITCHENKPLININGDVFIITDISYQNGSLRLAKSDLFDAHVKCPTPQHNFSYVGTPFTYSPATTDLFFFYNCTIPLDEKTYAVDCVNDSHHYSFAIFHIGLLRHWNYSIGLCRAWVNSPVEDDDFNKLLKMNYTEILKKGFVLQWSGRKSGNEPNVELKIWIGAGAAAGSAIIMCILFFIYHRRYKRRYTVSSSADSLCPMAKDLEKAGIHMFGYHELEVATDHFDPKRELGDGGYGAVYKGKLQDGRTVAVKRLYENHYRRVEQFMNEVEILTRLRHQNLVSLYGCTSSRDRELLLVYEYIPNGTLADNLHGMRQKPGSLSWITRLNIAIETASALAYLHASDVIHRDIKSTNILLDNNFTVKVADFGLSRLRPTAATHISTTPQGTPGYVDPEYQECYQLTEKSDVYSFGVVLMELISSQPAIDITRHRHEINLSTMAINKIQNGTLAELVDPHLGFESDYKVRTTVVAVAELAFQCLQNKRDMRPQVHDMLEALQDIQRKDYSTDVMDIPAADVLPLKSNSQTASSTDC